MFAIFKKELQCYFLTLTAWVFLAVFLVISGIMFSLQLVFSQSSEYSSYLLGLLFIFLVVIPLLTMRIFTDEKRFQTDQLLLTCSSKLWVIVVGKYLAAFSVFLITVLVTVFYPVFLSFHGQLDWPVIAGTYIGFLLLGSAFISIGVYVSQVAEGIVSAAVFTFCALMITFIIDFLRPYMPQTPVSGMVWIGFLLLVPLFRIYFTDKNWIVTAAITLVLALIIVLLWFFANSIFAGLIGKSFEWLSLTRRFHFFAMGILKLDAVLYYLSFTGFFLFLTMQSLEKRRWN